MQRLNFTNVALQTLKKDKNEKALSEKGGDSSRSRYSSNISCCKIIGPATRTNSARHSNQSRQDAKEQERKEFEKKVFAHHDASTRSASNSSFRTNNVRLLSQKSIRSAKAAIETLDYEVENFNDQMKEVIKREEERIEYEKKVKDNAG